MPEIIVDQQLFEMSAAQVETFPLGVIGLDPSGKILSYNATEAALARQSAAATLGRNFFGDVAPCTAVRAFRGRFDEFVAQQDSLCEEFRFAFRFAWGVQEVGITLVRRSPFDQRVFVVVNASKVDVPLGV